MLKRKLLRDLWQNRTQFISIFLMAFSWSVRFRRNRCGEYRNRDIYSTVL